MRRSIVFALVGALLILAGVLVGVRALLVPAAQDGASADAQQQGPVLIGGPFTLTDDKGKRVTDQDYRGKYLLVYFGYTFCPDVCPLGLQTVAQALDELPPDVADKVVPLFITVDPARDTVEVMHNYVGMFHPKLVGLTGSEQEVADTLRAYRVYARKAEGGGPDGYLVDHSTFTYLMGPDGAYVTHFGHGTEPKEMVERLTRTIRAG